MGTRSLGRGNRVAIAGAIVIAACTFAPPTVGPFYSIGPASVPRVAGMLIRREPMPGAPVGAQAWRVLYSSTGLEGEPIPVSGVVVIPGGLPPSGGWDVVAWAHPTVGVATNCAPSLREKPLESIPGLARLVARGYVVVATDYPGLGTAGAHPYLVGVSEGRAVLDIIRAARRFPGESVGTRFAVWGHSQGGQAALFAGQISSSYAPELALVTVGAVAPATDLVVMLDDAIASRAGRVLMSFAAWSWSRVYGAPIDSLIRATSIPTVNEVAAGCVETIGEIYQVARDAAPLDADFMLHHPDSIAPWHELLERNRPGAQRTGAPIYIVQGSEDQFVRPSISAAYATRMCAAGESVNYALVLHVGHVSAGKDLAPAMIGWIIERFAGNPAPNDCPELLKEAKPSG